MIGASALFAVMSAMVKALGDRIPFTELMFFRSFLAMPVVVALSLRTGARGAVALLRTRRFPGHVMRATTGTLAMASSFYALTVLPLAEQTALTSTTPIFVTILSIPVLGEVVRVHRWSAVLIGFAGIVVIALGQGAFRGGLGTLAAAGTAAAVSQGVFSAMTTLLVRQLSATESSATIVMWQSLLMSAFTAATLPFLWTTPAPGEVLLLLLIGLSGGIAQVMLTEAYASAQVSAIGPYSYTSILWSVLLGWMAFAEVPPVTTLVGAALIVASGLYILHRELVRSGRKRS